MSNPAAPEIKQLRLVVEVQAGAELVAEPRETPWRSLNSRLDAPAGLHVTLFEELETLEERTAREGFGTAEERD